MSLIRRLTDNDSPFRNLPYSNGVKGKSTVGNLTSGEPYIIKPLPKLNESTPGRTARTGGPDVLNRGGILSITRGVEDTLRLTKFFADFKPITGALFIAKQNLLSRTSVKTEASKGLGYGGGAVNQGIYTPLSTLTATAGNAVGIHPNTFGINPLSESSLILNTPIGTGLVKYGDITKANNQFDTIFGGGNLNKNNRLLNLYDKGVLNKESGPLLTYSGGPGSVLGIGTTDIKAAPPEQRTNPKNNQNIEDNKGNSATYTQKQLFDQTPVSKEGKIGDFRVKTRQIIAPNYNPSRNKTIEGPGGSRIAISSPGTKATYKILNQYDGGVNFKDAVDKINALEPSLTDLRGNVTGDAINDLVKFRIVMMGNDGDDIHLYFRAFINSFSDNYSAQWNPIQYVGRGDQLYNYEGFKREISMGFTVAAQSKAELIPMYKKLNSLASNLAPDYNSAGFMRGNLVKLTVGGYIYYQTGFLTSVNYTIPNDTTYEIGIDQNGEYDKDVKELPHRIDVSMNFTPIHDFLPQKQKGGANRPDKGDKGSYGAERYIALSTSEVDNAVTSNYDKIVENPRNSLPKLPTPPINKEAQREEQLDELVFNEDGLFDPEAQRRGL